VIKQDIDRTISDIVRNDYRTADVFKSFGINYCCSGLASVSEACNAREIDSDLVASALRKATRDVRIPNVLVFDSWTIDFLIDYIVNLHHTYIKIAIPNIKSSISSYVLSHSKQNTITVEVEDIFDQLSNALNTHSIYEEEIIFPYIKHLDVTHRRKEVYGSLFVRTLRKPLENIETEHQKITALLAQIKELTNNYTFPATACTNYRVVIEKLKEFHNDIVQHKHLEDDLLFPKAMNLERELLKLQTQ
jgi:regulator of cell morphogenesis and NO signaling